MPSRDEIMGKCISDLKSNGHEDLDVTLLDKIVEEEIPEAEDDADLRYLDDSDGDDLRRVKDEFLVGRLGLEDSDDLIGHIQKAIRGFGRENDPKMRPVIHYLLVKEFGKEDAFA